jgi:hypothetical protein
MVKNRDFYLKTLLVSNVKTRVSYLIGPDRFHSTGSFCFFSATVATLAGNVFFFECFFFFFFFAFLFFGVDTRGGVSYGSPRPHRLPLPARS